MAPGWRGLCPTWRLGGRPGCGRRGRWRPQNEPEEGRAAGVLPRQPQEVQAGHLGHAPLVHDLAFTDHPREVDPGVVGAVAGRPHHHPHVLQQAVSAKRAVRSSASTSRGRFRTPARSSLFLPVNPDDEVPAAHPPARPGGDRDPQQAQPGQPPGTGPGRRAAGAASDRWWRSTGRRCGVAASSSAIWNSSCPSDDQYRAVWSLGLR